MFCLSIFLRGFTVNYWNMHYIKTFGSPVKFHFFSYGLAYHGHLSVTKAEAFRKLTSNRKNFKLKRRFRVWTSVDGEGFENRLFDNDDVTKIT